MYQTLSPSCPGRFALSPPTAPPKPGWSRLSGRSGAPLPSLPQLELNCHRCLFGSCVPYAVQRLFSAFTSLANTPSGQNINFVTEKLGTRVGGLIDDENHQVAGIPGNTRSLCCLKLTMIRTFPRSIAQTCCQETWRGLEQSTCFYPCLAHYQMTPDWNAQGTGPRTLSPTQRLIVHLYFPVLDRALAEDRRNIRRWSTMRRLPLTLGMLTKTSFLGDSLVESRRLADSG